MVLCMVLLVCLCIVHDLEERPLPLQDESVAPLRPIDCVLTDTLLLDEFDLRTGASPAREIVCANSIASRYVPPSL